MAAARPGRPGQILVQVGGGSPGQVASQVSIDSRRPAGPPAHIQHRRRNPPVERQDQSCDVDQGVHIAVVTPAGPVSPR